MNGFFEYQYLSYKKKHMNNLIALARVDGNFHESELQILYKSGEKYRLKVKHIDALLLAENNLPVNLPGKHDQCMEQLYDLVEMMLADEIIKDSEILFCKEMIQAMGYDIKLLDQLIEFVQNDTKNHESWNLFKEEAKIMW